jgi:hypothetical protein
MCRRLGGVPLPQAAVNGRPPSDRARDQPHRRRPGRGPRAKRPVPPRSRSPALEQHHRGDDRRLETLVDLATARQRPHVGGELGHGGDHGGDRVELAVCGLRPGRTAIHRRRAARGHRPGRGPRARRRSPPRPSSLASTKGVFTNSCSRSSRRWRSLAARGRRLSVAAPAVPAPSRATPTGCSAHVRTRNRAGCGSKGSAGLRAHHTARRRNERRARPRLRRRSKGCAWGMENVDPRADICPNHARVAPAMFTSRNARADPVLELDPFPVRRCIRPALYKKVRRAWVVRPGSLANRRVLA